MHKHKKTILLSATLMITGALISVFTWWHLPVNTEHGSGIGVNIGLGVLNLIGISFLLAGLALCVATLIKRK